MSLADEQPVRVQRLEVTRLLDRLDREDALCAGCQGVSGKRTGPKHVDDDRNPARRRGARDEVG